MASWTAVVGLWFWRGKVKSRWENLGFDSGIFDLFMRMKGAKTRFNLIDALSAPKDRLQLAKELHLDWKAVEFHVTRLNKLGIVSEERAYGKVKMYRLTSYGEDLLQLLKDVDKEFNNGAESRDSSASKKKEKANQRPT
jgi:DNA-binding transcriptional ArsR family regulator